MTNVNVNEPVTLRYLSSVAPTVNLYDPSGTVTTPAPTQVGASSIYEIVVTPTSAGTWTVEWLETAVSQLIESVIAGGQLYTSGKTEINQDFTDVGGKAENDGIPVPNVRVRAFDANTIVRDEVYTDLNGNFVLLLPPGTYTLEFFKLNFVRVDSTGVIVT